MNIALCFSGMLRTFDKCAPTIIDYVIKANPEHQFSSFIATWDIHGRNPVWWEVSKDNTPIDYNLFVKYKKDLNIKKILIDTYEGSDFMKNIDVDLAGKYANRKGERCNPHNFLPMIKKIEQSHMLMLDNNVHYDVVVKMRADLFFQSKVEFRNPEPHTLYMPDHECWGPGHLNDQLIYGDGHMMSFHASLYRQLDNLYSKIPTLHPESILHNYYTEYKINIVRHPINYHIER